MTTTPRTHEGDLMELVRGADPLAGDVDPATDAAARVAAPRDSGSAPSGPLSQARPGTKVVVRLAAVGAAAAVAVAAIIAITGDDRGAVAPASAAVVRHALAAATQPPGTILHVDMRGTQNNGDGTTITWRDESWQENSAPYDRRQVETNPDGTTVESGNVGDSEQVYDSATNTIYASGSTASQASRANGARSAQSQTRTITGSLPDRPQTPTWCGSWSSESPRDTDTRSCLAAAGSIGSSSPASQAKALKDSSSIIKWVRAPRAAGTLNGYRPAVVPAPAAATAPDCSDFGSQDYGDQILTMLRSCGAHVVGHANHRRPRHAGASLPGRPYHLLRRREQLRPRPAGHNRHRRRYQPPLRHLGGAARRTM